MAADGLKKIIQAQLYKLLNYELLKIVVKNMSFLSKFIALTALKQISVNESLNG